MVPDGYELLLYVEVQCLFILSGTNVVLKRVLITILTKQQLLELLTNIDICMCLPHILH